MVGAVGEAIRARVPRRWGTWTGARILVLRPTKRAWRGAGGRDGRRAGDQDHRPLDGSAGSGRRAVRLGLRFRADVFPARRCATAGLCNVRAIRNWASCRTSALRSGSAKVCGCAMSRPSSARTTPRSSAASGSPRRKCGDYALRALYESSPVFCPSCSLWVDGITSLSPCAFDGAFAPIRCQVTTTVEVGQSPKDGEPLIPVRSLAF
jgi:hypothetical protein